MTNHKPLVNIVKFFWIPVLFLLLAGIFYFRPKYSGYAAKEEPTNYRARINQTFSNSSTYVLDIGGKSLTSLRVSGYVAGNGSVEIYLIKDGTNYTVLDYGTIASAGIASITGFASKDEKDKKEKDKVIENENELYSNDTSNLSHPTANKSIKIDLQYKTNSLYDEDNDGIESISSPIDLTVENSQFSWEANQSRLCVKWEAYNLNEEKITTLCYGSQECCSLIGLEPKRENWNDAFYSIYSQDGIGLNNIISARLIYADYSLSIDSPHSNIIYSDWSNLSAGYIYDKILFADACKDTCILENFNDGPYTLIIDLENATIQLDEIYYSLLSKNENYKLKLSLIGKSGTIPSLTSIYQGGNLISLPTYESHEIGIGLYDIEIAPFNKSIEKIILNGILITEDAEKHISYDDIDNNILFDDASLDGIDVKKAYWFDLTSFENATAIATAAANMLLKCRKWNSNIGSCSGDWENIENLTVGETYEIPLANEISAFIEGNPNNDMENNSLIFVKDIQNISITSIENASIDLSKHFLNIDNYTIFYYYEQENLSIVFSDGIATIIPPKNFTGTLFMFITANKSGHVAISNVFSLIITNAASATLDFSFNLDDPLIQQRLKEYTDIELKPIFNYNQINFTGFEIRNNVVTIYIMIDGRSMTWLTSLKTLDEVLS